MISLDVNHPDIEEFVDIKANTDQITNANISVRINDKFMQAVLEDKDYILRWPCDIHIDETQYKDLKYGEMLFIETQCGPVYIKKIHAKELFKRLAHNNWDYGEPGILYWDRIKNWNMMSADQNFYYAGVNPCAEEPLPNFGACLLGSINLAAYVVNGKFDFEQFDKDVKVATIALNDVQKEGILLHPLKQQSEVAQQWNQIGLGIMGLGDCLIKLGVVYGSEDSLYLCDKIAHSLLNSAYEASCHIEGIKYPQAMKSDFYKANLHEIKDSPHNSQLLTIAPTGSLSTMLNISGGIEPLFALEYTRTTKSLYGKDVTYKVYPKIVQDYMLEHNTDILPEYFVSSSTIDYKNRIKMQAVWQRYIDASISSTLNLPKEATEENVYDIYLEAWKNNLKGITIFRDGCKRASILTTHTDTKEDTFGTHSAPKRPKVLNGDFYKIRANGEYYSVFVGLMNNLPYEVFALPVTSEDYKNLPNNAKGLITKIKKRHYRFTSIDETQLKFENLALDPQEYKEWRDTTISVSAMLRHGMPIESVMKLQDKIDPVITSFKRAIWKVLNKYVNRNENDEVCPECGNKITHESGCKHCLNCGWSACLFSYGILKYNVN